MSIPITSELDTFLINWVQTSIHIRYVRVAVLCFYIRKDGPFFNMHPVMRFSLWVTPQKHPSVHFKVIDNIGLLKPQSHVGRDITVTKQRFESAI